MFSEQSEEKLLIKSLLCRFLYILKTSCISVGPKNPIFSSCISTAVKTERVWGKRTQWRNVAILQRPCTQVSTEHRQVGCSTWCIVPKPASVKMTVEPSSGDLWRKSDLHARLQGVCVCVRALKHVFTDKWSLNLSQGGGQRRDVAKWGDGSQSYAHVVWCDGGYGLRCLAFFHFHLLQHTYSTMHNRGIHTTAQIYGMN